MANRAISPCRQPRLRSKDMSGDVRKANRDAEKKSAAFTILAGRHKPAEWNLLDEIFWVTSSGITFGLMPDAMKPGRAIEFTVMFWARKTRAEKTFRECNDGRFVEELNAWPNITRGWTAAGDGTWVNDPPTAFRKIAAKPLRKR